LARTISVRSVRRLERVGARSDCDSGGSTAGHVELRDRGGWLLYRMVRRLVFRRSPWVMVLNRRS
jgi:hypothetical protein